LRHAEEKKADIVSREKKRGPKKKKNPNRVVRSSPVHTCNGGKGRGPMGFPGPEKNLRKSENRQGKRAA